MDTTLDHLAIGPSAVEVFTTPLDAPAYPPYPIRFRDCEILTIQYRTEPDAIAALLPEPLTPIGDTVLVHVARYGDVEGVGAMVHECNVMVGARLVTSSGTVEGSYSPYFFLDSDGAVALGREVQGQPKKLAQVALEARGDLFVGTVSRNGIDVLTATLPYKTRRASLDEARRRIDFVTNINLKVIQHIDGRTAVRQLVARDLADVVVLECWSGPCTVEVRPNAQAPLYRLPVREPLEGYYWRSEFSLVGGRVLLDYLHQRN
ncbi:MAG TPA: acetoacetate decarboxylase [Chloroflexota bacterium]